MAQARAQDRLLKPADVAEICGVTPRTVYSWLDRQWLPYVTLGPSRLLRIKASELEKFIEASDAA